MTKVKIQITNRRGQSLVEVLIAIAVGSLIIGGAVAAVALTLRADSRNVASTTAIPLGEDLLSKTRSVADNRWLNLYNEPRNTDLFIAHDTTLRVVRGVEGVVGDDIVNGLVGYWKLDEATGSTVYDYSALNNKGTAYNNPARATGKVGGAFSFDNTNAQYIDLGNPSSLSITGDQTIAMWLNPSELSVRRNPYAKSYGGEGTITMEPAGNFNYYYGTCGGNCSPYQGFGSGTAISTNQWSHIAIVRDLTNLRLYWYINGTRTSTASASYAAAAASGLSTFIARGYVNNFAGLIDDVRIYNRALSASEISQIYKSRSFTRSFTLENVSRDASGNIGVGREDPSTQKVNVKIGWTGGNEINFTQYLTRSRNDVEQVTDWSDQQSYEAQTGIDINTPGEIKLFQ